MPADRLDLVATGARRSPSTQVVVARRARTAPRRPRPRPRPTIAEIVRWRRENQPGGPNAGSVFTNPPGDSAGRLIEASRAKGLRVGHRRGVDQARQLHPGRRGRPGRRRVRARWSRSSGGSSRPPGCTWSPRPASSASTTTLDHCSRVGEPDGGHPVASDGRRRWVGRRPPDPGSPRPGRPVSRPGAAANASSSRRRS